ncbi:hypothetical protein HAX54_024965, partial [Datura stramonium]|nr:hypothetical protein [Datura stramonium]
MHILSGVPLQAFPYFSKSGNFEGRGVPQRESPHYRAKKGNYQDSNLSLGGG